MGSLVALRSPSGEQCNDLSIFTVEVLKDLGRTSKESSHTEPCARAIRSEKMRRRSKRKLQRLKLPKPPQQQLRLTTQMLLLKVTKTPSLLRAEIFLMWWKSQARHLLKRLQFLMNRCLPRMCTLQLRRRAGIETEAMPNLPLNRSLLKRQQMRMQHPSLKDGVPTEPAG